MDPLVKSGVEVGLGVYFESGAMRLVWLDFCYNLFLPLSSRVLLVAEIRCSVSLTAVLSYDCLLDLSKVSSTNFFEGVF
jgi:hypothetical protein